MMNFELHHPIKISFETGAKVGNFLERIYTFFYRLEKPSEVSTFINFRSSITEVGE